MIFKNLRKIFITSIIVKVVESTYIYDRPPIVESAQNCFRIGDNKNDMSRCNDFIGYYIPITREYSDYTSFSAYINNKVLKDDTLNREFLQPVGCRAEAQSISNKEEVFCSYVVYESLMGSRCRENGASPPTPSSYMCISRCQTYVNQLKAICPASSYEASGANQLESYCKDFRDCGDIRPANSDLLTTSNVVSKGNTDNSNNLAGKINNQNNLNTTTVIANNVNVKNNTAINNTNTNQNTNGGTTRNDIDNNSNNSAPLNNNGRSNGNQIGNEVGIDKNILYTLGFMVPISLFVGFGFIYYRKKVNNKSYDVETNSYSYHNFSSKHSSSQNLSEHSMSSNRNSILPGGPIQGYNNKVFSIGLTPPRNITTAIPITNQNIDINEQDNMATTCVAELISTATMINAANNNFNNIQPITPNEVNINVNTRYNTLNSHNSSQNNSPHPSKRSSLKSNNSSLSYNRKLPSYVINKSEDNTNNEQNNKHNNSFTSLNINIKPPANNNFRLTLPIQSPTTSIDPEASPIVDLSISHENDPLINIKKTNSFYHSSVSSESKKYNSFIAPISPIMNERSCEDNQQNDGKNNRKSYTNHLLTESILVDNKMNDDFEEEEDDLENDGDDEDNGHSLESLEVDEDLPLEEENTDLRPSKIFSTDFSEINNESSSQFNNVISVTVDDADENGRSSKYSSAKIPLSVMTVVQEFEPRMEDELALQINDRILLLKVFDDGWALGLNQMTGKQGVFPMEYVVSSELIKSTNKFASQIEYRNVLPTRTQSQAFSNFSFTSTTINDSVIHLTDCDIEYTNSNSMLKSQSISSSKYYGKSSILDSTRKSKLNASSVIEN